MIAVTLILLRVNSLGWLEIPPFFIQMIFFTNSRQIAKK